MKVFSKGITVITIFIFIISLGLLFSLRILDRHKVREVSKAQLLMGTLVEIRVEGNDREGSLKAIEKAFLEIRRLSAIMSHYREGSEVRALERAAPGWVRISPEMLDVLEESVRISELSQGAFDITVGVLGKVWSFDEEERRIPARGEIEELLPFVNFRNIEIDSEKSSARLTKKGMRLTLGGIGKGYIVDRAMEVIRASGIKNAMINAGGDIKVIREKGERPWKIGIKHPRKKGIFAILEITDGSVATSGDYERFFIENGERYHHILNPRTGFPAEGVMSVTVIAPDSYYSDALATAVFVLGMEKGSRLIEELEGVEGIIVDKKGKIWSSTGLEGRVKFLED